MSDQQPPASYQQTHTFISPRDRWLPLMRAAWLVLAGITTVGFVAGVPLLFAQVQTVCTAAQCFGWQLTPQGLQALQREGLPVTFYAVYAVGLNSLLVLSFLAVSVLIMWRKGRDRSAVLMALILTIFAVAGVVTLAGTVWNLPDYISYTILGPALALLFYLFPNGKFVPGWTRWAAVFVVVANLAGVLLPDWYNATNGIASLASYLTGIGAQVYRYRRVSTPLERQQTKWAVFGIGLAVVGFTILGFVGGLFPETGDVSGGLPALAVAAIWPISYSLIPVSIGIAILRSRLYDIDIIIQRTLVYGALTALLVGVYVGSVVLLQELSRPLFGGSNDLAIVISTLAIAALFMPLRRRVQSGIDRRFYRRKYDAARTLAEFGQVARDEVDLETLTDRLARIVDETMQPQHLSIWLRAPGMGSRAQIAAQESER